jgi:hypothetical protein
MTRILKRHERSWLLSQAPEPIDRAAALTQATRLRDAAREATTHGYRSALRAQMRTEALRFRSA